MTYDKDLGSCTSGCVEILGLHATVAPRRPRDQSDPVLESYSFVPYHFSALSQTDQSASLSQCFSLLENKVESLKNETAKKSFLEDLNKLQKIDDKSSKKPLYELVEKASTLKEPTKQLNVFVDEVFGNLRDLSLVDLVVENIEAEKKLLLVEAEASKGRLYEGVVKRLSKEPGLRFEYLAGGLNEEVDGVENIQWSLDKKPSDRSVYYFCLNFFFIKIHVKSDLSSLMILIIYIKNTGYQVKQI